MTGLIAVPTRVKDPRRHEEVFENLEALQKPEGTEVRFYSGLAHENHQRATEEMLAEGGKWIFYVDDDQLLPPDALVKLLSHDRSVVTVNFLSKERPWTPYLFRKIAGLLVPEALGKARGLRSVDACGLGGVLVRSYVFDRLPRPWFGVTPEFRTDDLFFSHVVRAAGFDIICDLDVCASHIIKGVVQPYWDPGSGQWMTVIHIKAGGSFVVPPAVPTPEYQDWLDQQQRHTLKGHTHGSMDSSKK